MAQAQPIAPKKGYMHCGQKLTWWGEMGSSEGPPGSTNRVRRANMVRLIISKDVLQRKAAAFIPTIRIVIHYGRFYRAVTTDMEQRVALITAFLRVLQEATPDWGQPHPTLEKAQHFM
jgi:hypothetical protein